MSSNQQITSTEIYELAETQIQKILFLEGLKISYEQYKLLDSYLSSIFEKFQLLGFSNEFILSREEAIPKIEKRLEYEKEILERLSKQMIKK